MVELHIEALERSFGDRRVLTGITTSLQGGDRLLVRGPNGSGKSTLLKVLCGVLAPTGGRIRLLDSGEERDADWRRHVTSYLGPDLVLYEEFSALENLDFFGRLRGLGRDEARDLALLKRLGLGARAHDAIGTLSTGMRQRAKLAFVLQAAPKLLLLDEPGSNLDDAGRALVASAVEESAAAGGIVVIASNDPAEFALGRTTLALA